MTDPVKKSRILKAIEDILSSPRVGNDDTGKLNFTINMNCGNANIKTIEIQLEAVINV